MTLTVYADTTGLFTEEELWVDNLCDLEVPEEIVREYYEKYKDELEGECVSNGYEPSFENWYTAVYTADSTDDFIAFAEDQYGYKPILAE